MISVQEVTVELESSRKYARVCPATRARIAAWAAARASDPRDAVKRAKRKLHQVCGAFLSVADLRALERQLATLDLSDPRAVCETLLSAHASTRERRFLLERLFPRLFAELGGAPASVLDIGCGFGALLLPWMALPAGARYVGTDIDGALVVFVARAAVVLGLPAELHCRDALVDPPETGDAEVAFLFKLLPSLEQQQEGAGFALLDALVGAGRVRAAVVSFPTRSLGGREVGMRENYGARMEEHARRAAFALTRIDFPEELFFVVRRR